MQDLRTVIYMGERALESLYEAQRLLKSAGNWGLLDALGGGLLTTWVKHSRIDDAEEVLGEARERLGSFTAAVRSFPGFYQLHIEIGGFLSAADYLLDGLLADYLVYSRIRNAQGEVDDVIFRLEGLLGELKRGNGR